jgi:hypothetical protein
MITRIASLLCIGGFHATISMIHESTIGILLFWQNVTSLNIFMFILLDIFCSKLD